jgi:methionyl-tRNA synthetase
LELVQADFLARYHRMRGDDVYFQTGVDEHGVKMEKAATAAGSTPEQFIVGQHEIFSAFAASLNVQADRFIRTSDDDHKMMAQALWRACSGDIYKQTYRAWYDVKQEEFLGSADEFPDGKVFGVEERFLELIEEENYFFRASKYTDQVLSLLRSGEYALYPAHRAAELIKFVEEKGLQDISISRDKARLAWGIPVPDDENQVMYVWFDALANYLTGCGAVENDKIVTDNRWPIDLHCVGKDISRFHGLLWPAMLFSAGLPLPRALLVHGFVLKDGHVMSKSLGNVIDAAEPIEKYGADALRWYFLKGLPTTEDGDFTMERMAEVYASDLANDYGNLISRVLTMTHKYCDGFVPSVTPEQVANLEQVIVEERWAEYDTFVTALRLNDALSAAQQLVVFCNRRIEELKPWELAKDESRKGELDELLYELLEIIRHVTSMIWPAMPGLAERVSRELFPAVPSELWHNGELARTWGSIRPGDTLGAAPLILFPRVEL